MIDGKEADDKNVGVLNNDAMYCHYKDITDLPEMVIERLKHYSLTYKDLPSKESDVEIIEVYGAKEASEVIERSITDYHNKFEKLQSLLSNV